jgi:very-short-patch-repair endonuclease
MRNTNLARALRQSAPAAERRLWRMVRAHRLGGYKFRRQIPIDRYIVDFVCMDARLIVELDGPTHEEREAEDAARTEVLQQLGYVVIRFPNDEVLWNIHAVEMRLRRELANAQPGRRAF